MSYNATGLYIDRGRTNNAAGESAYACHGYKSTTDTLATITAANYFPENLDARSDEVELNDLMIINASDDARIYKISALSPFTLVEEVLSDNPFNQSLNTTDTVDFNGVNLSTGGLGYTEKTTITATWGGPFASPESGDITLFELGSMKILQLPTIQQTATTGAEIVLSTPLAVAYRPTAQHEQQIVVQDNGTLQDGSLVLQTNGNISIFADLSGGAFAGSGNTGFRGIYITYFSA